MKIVAKFAFALAMMACAAAVSTTAQARWEFLGERAVGKDRDRDVINLRGEGAFKRIRICVRRRAVRFFDVDVIFGNGASQDIRIRNRIGPGDCTRAIDLRGNRRFIRRIVMRYETIRVRGPRAIVEVYGRR